MTLIYSTPDENPAKARPALLPLLVVLFIASYAILTMLVVEQGRTIDAQRGLLREMLKDSVQLADLKGKLARANDQQNEAKSAGRPDTAQKPQAGSAGAAPQKGPANNEPQRREKVPHAMKEIPTKPAADLQDVRRSTREI